MLTPSRICNKCGFVAYPRISPVCIVLISRGDEILLARSPHFSPGMYSALAGFVEAGESLEAGVHREVREEVGIEICNLLWFGSQSWPFPHSLMLGFMADYAGGTLLLQEEEIEDAQWFRRDHLPALPHPSTIAYRMIRTWLDQG
jgi:NAD+ diphosphatase